MSRGIVPVFAQDAKSNGLYDRRMAKAPSYDWFLNDWLDSLNMSPAELMRAAGWSKRKISELTTGRMRYNRDVVNEAAAAMNIRPHELLMHPADAMAIRSFDSAVRLAAERRSEYKSEQPSDRRKAS